MCGPPLAVHDFNPGLLARNGLFQLVRESSRGKGQGSFWWIPLNSLARHSVSREEITRKPESPAVAGLLKSLITSGFSWDEDTGNSHGSAAIDYSPARHIFAISGLYSRKLQNLLEIEPDRFSGEVARIKLADLFAAWNYARRPG